MVVEAARVETHLQSGAESTLPPFGAAVHRLAMPWIVRLRYGMITGEIALLTGISLGLDVPLPIFLLAVVIGVQVLSNVVVSRRQQWQRHAEHLAGILFCLDILCLTLILAFTGGPANPFSLLYLVLITFSAVILHKAWTWALGILSTLCFGLLFRVSIVVPALQVHLQAGEFSLHLVGMWIAFATAALLISFFIARVSGEMLAMQKRLARNERLASLVTLSAGAAHEIATPLATIAVTAREMERTAALRPEDQCFEEDAALIRSQVERCREILARMGAQGADPLGEAPAIVDIHALLSRLRGRFPGEPSRIQTEVPHSVTAFRLPVNATVEVLAALVKNGLDASADNQPVTLRVRTNGNRIQFIVEDRGAGMTPAVMERVLEPFFTTKPVGKGMGLGAFLAHLFAQRLGVELSYRSKPGEGCTAILELPAAIDDKG